MLMTTRLQAHVLQSHIIQRMGDLWQAVPPYIDVTGCAYWQRQGWHYHLWFLSTSMRAKLRESLPMIIVLKSITSAGMSARPAVKQI